MTGTETGTPEVPRPQVSPDDARAMAADLYGISGAIKELGSQQDRNFRFDTGSERYLLKFANPAFDPAELEAQNAGLQLLLAAGLHVPEPIPSRNGNLLETSTINGESLTTRLASFVEGTPLTDAGHLAQGVVGELGDLAARTVQALAGFDHQGIHRVLQWDLKRAAPVVRELAGFIGDERARADVLEATEQAWRTVSGLAPGLREQAIHGDLTDDNVVAHAGSDGRLHPFGVIDFGDLNRTWLVGEIAVTCSSVLHHVPDDPLAVLPAIAAFHARVPFESAEVAAIWPLIVLRGAVLAASGEHQVSVDPGNEYAVNNLPHEWEVFRVARSLPAPVAEAAIRQTLGMPAAADPYLFTDHQPLIPDLADVTVLDLSTTGPALHAGVWELPGIEAELFEAAEAPVAARHGEARLTRAAARRAIEPLNVALGVELRLAAGTRLLAPADGEVSADRSGLRLRTPGWTLHVAGVRPLTGGPVPTGTVIAESGAEHVFVTACTDPDLHPPRFVAASQAPAWLSVCPDPSSILGLAAGTEWPDAEGLLRRRDDAFARIQGHYYTAPPEFERGWREHMIDTRGRVHLDMVNNVTSIGHGHPRLAAAVNEQWLRLNTNSRFHYRAVVDFSERLKDVAPDHLDTVLLVNSGSEAVDLALRLVQAATSRTTVVALDEAYHGWTMASDAVSASTADNPNAIGSRPDWVRFLGSPNTYRGLHRGPGAAAGYIADAAERLATWDGQGVRPAGFICEPIFGNGGGILLPDGYLRGIYELIRQRGGLCISDEVQVGYGRLGHYFWGCQQQGVLPDVITVAKSMGNGHPLGAVLTTAEIAAGLASQGRLFSSPGGSPVSCVVGLSVLDTIRDEGLQQNAATVGDYLQARLAELSTRHPMVGAVHGMGLYLGVELIRDAETLEPAAEEAAAICDRMLQRGIIVQPTGDRFNVLKVKPPLCLSVTSADFFVDQLNEVLTNGW